MEKLKWPVTKCEHCGFDLKEATPHEKEKGNDANGKLIWTDFCPKCGTGYQVGYRVVPKPTAEVLAEQEAAPVLSYVEEKAVERKPSGIPPDERGKTLDKEKQEENPDPENLLGTEPQPEPAPEPGAIRPPRKKEYFCTKCASIHSLKETSKIGKRHLKYRE